MMTEYKELTEAVVAGDSEKAVRLTEQAMGDKVAAREILGKWLLPSMDIIGEQFEKGEIFFPELLMGANAMKAAVALLKPELSKSKVPTVGKYLIGTVPGDAHDIGKNIVMMMLEQNGWEVTDLGVDVPEERYCEAVKEGDYDIVGLSALLTFTVPMLKEVINALKAEGLRDKVKVMVGGAPVTQKVADEAGADAYAKDAVEAVKKAKALLGR
jgi:5-methyltetrahydrofolate--homocysteine methyltransferase